MERKYFAVTEEGMIRISSYDYIDNGDFWECKDMQGGCVDLEILDVIYIEDNEPHYLPAKPTGKPIVIEIDALPESLRHLINKE